MKQYAVDVDDLHEIKSRHDVYADDVIVVKKHEIITKLQNLEEENTKLLQKIFKSKSINQSLEKNKHIRVRFTNEIPDLDSNMYHGFICVIDRGNEDFYIDYNSFTWRPETTDTLIGYISKMRKAGVVCYICKDDLLEYMLNS